MSKLPDGSGFFLGSSPLPEDHWIYESQKKEWDKERDCLTEQPKPILTHELSQKVKEAARYAIRSATMNGTEMDFDPDALVQNMVVALCGNYPVKVRQKIN